MTRFYTYSCVYGKNILVRGWDDDQGGHFMEKVPYRPTMYLRCTKESEYHTLEGKPVMPVLMEGLKEGKQYIKDHNAVTGFGLYGMDRFLYQYLAEEYPDKIEHDMDRIKVWSLDIETKAENGFPKPELAEEEVLLITLKNFRTKNLITFGTRPYNNTNPKVNYILCEDETALLGTFLRWWIDEEPEVITGWNVNLFDITYLCNRIANVFGEPVRNKLSPWGVIYDREVFTHGRKQQAFQILGVNVLDYLDIYKKFTYTNRESYALDMIAEVELGEHKLDHSEYDTFREFYSGEFNVREEETPERGSVRHLGRLRSKLKRKLEQTSNQ